MRSITEPLGSRKSPHRVVIAVARQSGNRPAFSVTLDGQVIAESADPEFAACRALLALGHKGRLVTRWEGSTHDALVLDIERGAQLATTDSASGRLSFIKFVPMTHDWPSDSVGKRRRLSQGADLVTGG